MTSSTPHAWPKAEQFAQFKYALLLRTAHEVGATITPEPSEVIASASIQYGKTGVLFSDVKPAAKGDQIQSIAFSNDLHGEALIVIDKTMTDRWATPNGSDIVLKTGPD